MKKEDQFYRYAPLFDCYSLKPSELVEGMYVARINSKEKKLENKYVIVKIPNKDKDNRRLRVYCYDFIENKMVEVEGINVFNFFDVLGNDGCIEFYYKYKYSTLDDYKKFNIGDEVVFINPEDHKNRLSSVFKIIKKQKKYGNDGQFDLMDANGFVLHNIPGILLKQLFGKEDNEKNRPTFSIRSLKPIAKVKNLKFSVNIDYTNGNPIEFELNGDKTSVSASLGEKLKISNTLKKIINNCTGVDKDEKVFELVSGKTKYWRFSPFNFKHFWERVYDTNDLTSHVDFKCGNVFSSKEDLIRHSGEENVKKIKEKLAKYILEAK